MKLLCYREDRQRGTTDFPLEYHYLNADHPRYQMPYHWHEEYELLYIQKGTFHMTLDDEAITLQEGDTALIASGCLHGGVPVNCVYECIVFDMRLLLKCNPHCKQQIEEILYKHMAVQSYFHSSDEAAFRMIPVMFDALRTQCSGWELITLGSLYQFLGECFKIGTYQPIKAQSFRENKRILQLKTVFELIENEYASPLTLEQLAASVHMSPKYFCRFFKAATHRTPIDYLNYYRIEAACSEMASTVKNITEVAFDAGFSNCSYFIRTFRKYKGITPGQYMAAVRKK